MKDKITSIQRLKDLTRNFVEERNWGKHNTSKNLAISIAIEAAELMEHFQWDEYKSENKKELEGELADIIIYCLHFANLNRIDIAKAVEEKLKRNAKKYPVKVFNNKKDSPKDYWRIKKAYRNKK